MNKKTFSYLFIGAFIFMVWYTYTNNDFIAQTIAQNGLTGIFWYFITNFSYILILASIFSLNSEVAFYRNLLGGLLIIFAVDIVSFPRFSPTGLSNEMMLLASSDGIFINTLLSFGLGYSTVYFIYYLFLPIVLILSSLSILGISDFFRRLISHA